MDSVLSSEFRAALKQHQGLVVACCADRELSLYGDQTITRLKAMQRSQTSYAFSIPVKETLEKLGKGSFFHFEPRDGGVMVEDSFLRFEKVALPELPPKPECKAVVRGENLQPLSNVQFVGKGFTFALEQTQAGTALVITDGYALHHIVMSISAGDETFVSTTSPTFDVFRRGAVEVLANETQLVLKQGGLELYLERGGTLPDYKKVLRSLKVYEQFTVPVKPLRDKLEPFKRDKKKQIVLTLKMGELEVDGNAICRTNSNKSLMLNVLARLLFDALSDWEEVEFFLTGNNTPFIVRSHKRWAMLVPIPAKEIVQGAGANLLEALEGLPELARAA